MSKNTKRTTGNIVPKSEEVASAGRRSAKRTDGARLEPLTIRMDAKLKFGLELLARLQGRSISQAIEWALQYALVNVEGDLEPVPLSLWAIIIRAWEQPAGWLRVRSLYTSNPSLVSFEERHACKLILQSTEQQFLFSQSDGTAKFKALEADWCEIIAWAWPKLLADASIMQIGLLQKEGPKHPLCIDLGIKPDGFVKMSIEELLPAAAKFCREHVDGAEPGMPPFYERFIGDGANSGEKD